MTSLLSDYGPQTDYTPVDKDLWGQYQQPSPPADNSKAIYRQIADSSSSESVQENLYRIVQRDIKEAIDKSRKMVFHLSTPQEFKSTSIDLSEVINFIIAGGSTAVEEIIKSLRKKTRSKELFDTIQKALTDAIDDSQDPNEGFEARLNINKLNSFIHRAQCLDEKARTDAALDILYDGVDQLMRDGNFSELNTLIGELSAEEYSLDLLLGILTATLPARKKLPARASFFNDAAAVIRRRGEYENDLLTGLD